MSGWISRLSARCQILQELFAFLWQNRQWFLLPIVLALVALISWQVYLGHSAIAPFIYTLF